MLLPCPQVFCHSELSGLEGRADGVDSRARAGLLPQSCHHTSLSKGGALKRTKFFFGARCINASLLWEVVLLWQYRPHYGILQGPSAHVQWYCCYCRYLWTREQMSEQGWRVAGGVRVDVPPPPSWMPVRPCGH